MRIRRRSRSSSTPASDPFAGLVLYDVDCIPVSLDERKGIALAWDVLLPRRVSPYSGTSEGVPVLRADFERLLPSAARRAFTQTREGAQRRVKCTNALAAPPPLGSYGAGWLTGLSTRRSRTRRRQESRRRR